MITQETKDKILLHINDTQCRYVCAMTIYGKVTYDKVTKTFKLN